MVGGEAFVQTGDDLIRLGEAGSTKYVGSEVYRCAGFARGEDRCSLSRDSITWGEDGRAPLLGAIRGK
jgi:hypothetical protein